MRRVVPLPLLSALLLAFACSEGEPPDPPRAGHGPAIDLPRVPIVESYLAAEHRLIINLDADGNLSVAGEAVELDSLEDLLAGPAGRVRLQDAERSSRLDVVLRLERRTPWICAVWLMQACADPDVRANRIHLAARPADGGEEGVVRLFLPVQGSGCSFPLRHPFQITGDGSGMSLTELRDRLHQRLDWYRDGMAFDPEPLIPIEYALRTVVLLREEGVRDVWPVGRIVRSPRDIKAKVEESRRQSIRPGVVIETVAESYWRDDPKAIRGGLEWLAASQGPERRWHAGRFTERDGGAGAPRHEVGVNALAVLAFLGNGQTHKHGPQKATVKNGLRFLKQNQDAEGCFGPRSHRRFLYDHALATLAMCEAYAYTSSPLFKQSAQQGIDFLESCRNPDLAWRYGVRPGENDTSASAWAVLALLSARRGGLRVNDEALAGMRVWLAAATDPETGRVGYAARGTLPFRDADRALRFPAELSEANTAAGVFCRVMLGEDPETSPAVRMGTELCLRLLPEWNEKSGGIDMTFWLFGSVAMHRVGGEGRDRWGEAMKKALAASQDPDGSWAPAGVWGPEGGRIVSTSLMILCAELCYGYRRVIGTEWK